MFTKCPSHNNLSKTTSTMIHNMMTWCDKNSLRLNIDKTSFLVYSAHISKRSLYIRVNSGSLPQSSEVKFLGTFDRTLNWNEHIETLSKN